MAPPLSDKDFSLKLVYYSLPSLSQQEMSEHRLTFS
jgi:hypothetical protein